MLPRALYLGGVSGARLPLMSLDPLMPGRIFELLMAFDALRLRNVIQLVGILGEYTQTGICVLRDLRA